MAVRGWVHSLSSGSKGAITRRRSRRCIRAKAVCQKARFFPRRPGGVGGWLDSRGCATTSKGKLGKTVFATAF